MALILPVALMLMSLVVYGGQAYRVQRRVTLAATTVANIFAQANNNNQSTITAAELNQILAYPNLILYPYDASTAASWCRNCRSPSTNGTATGTVGTCPITGSPSAPSTGQWQLHAAHGRHAIVDRSFGRFRLFRPGPMTIPLAAVSPPIPSLPITSFSEK